jgi:hypothetical protein
VPGHLPKLLADDADRDVGRTAGAEGHHDPDRFRRIFVLCRSTAGAAGKEEERQYREHRTLHDHALFPANEECRTGI